MTTLTEHRQRAVLAWTEKQFQQQVVALAKTLGWRVYHPYDSRRSTPGYPDLTMVHPTHGVLWAELKTENGRISPAQQQWLNDLIGASGGPGGRSGMKATIWRPRHWNDGSIHAALGAQPVNPTNTGGTP